MEKHTGKYWRCAVALLLAVCLLTSCGGAEPAVSDASEPSDVSSAAVSPARVPVTLSDDSLEIGKGIARQITARGGASVRWSSSDPAIASVDEKGSVKGESPGECVVTAENESGESAQCQVTVKKTCYLTIDDGPGEYTKKLLAVLKKHDVKATFFVVNNSFIARSALIHEDGHVIGLHAGVHIFRYCYRSDSDYFCDIAKLNQQITEYTGKSSNLLRFPGGTNNSQSDLLIMRRLVNGADDLGYRVFDWTGSAGDTDPAADSETSYTQLLRSCFRDEEILLMHDLSFTPDALNRLIPALRKRGYIFETLDHYPERSYRWKCRYSRLYRDVPARDIALECGELTLPVGDSHAFSPRMTPADATDFVRWVSADESVLTVDCSGRVTANAAGETYLFAFTSNDNWTACKVTVTES